MRIKLISEISPIETNINKEIQKINKYDFKQLSLLS